jgi:response regulator of citrate/malate metabolism
VTAQRAQENALKRSAQRRVAEELREQFGESRVSQRRVAEYLGMTPSTFSTYMLGVSLWPQGPAHFGFAVTRAITALEVQS